MSDRALRLWQIWPSKSKFFLDGRLITGPERGGFWGTNVLILFPALLFFFTEAALLWVRVSPWLVAIGIYSLPFNLVVLFLVGHTDPGIVPRRRPADFDYRRPGASSATDRVEVKRNIVIDGQTLALKYCATCEVFRLPRTAHCVTCDNCVEHFDHHCPWVGNCVARRNYRYFLWFLTATTFNTGYLFVTAAWSLYLVYLEAGDVLPRDALMFAVAGMPGSVLLLLYTFFIVWTVGGLMCYHWYLALIGQTTNQQIKRTGLIGNPFSRGLLTNCAYQCCFPWTPLISWRSAVSVSLPAAADLERGDERDALVPEGDEGDSWPTARAVLWVWWSRRHMDLQNFGPWHIF
eukprot:TRINITY_DN3520_c0_g1_i1.p1 TRINITY_DN3520_c0_g1~~TRINITY_DN3520_c0_g1_i1.p1  ORF type:complete len:348 (-),score=59.52 TRINITY_DN3520_c0_g1_i1:361-1404(-)